MGTPRQPGAAAKARGAAAARAACGSGRARAPTGIACVASRRQICSGGLHPRKMADGSFGSDADWPGNWEHRCEVPSRRTMLSPARVHKRLMSPADPTRWTRWVSEGACRKEVNRSGVPLVAGRCRRQQRPSSAAAAAVAMPGPRLPKRRLQLRYPPPRMRHAGVQTRHGWPALSNRTLGKCAGIIAPIANLPMSFAAQLPTTHVLPPQHELEATARATGDNAGRGTVKGRTHNTAGTWTNCVAQ